MKKTIIKLACFLVIMAATSCANDAENIDNSAQEKLVSMSFHAVESLQNNDEITSSAKKQTTRTALLSDFSTVTWQQGDKIGIGYLGSPGKKTYPFTTPTEGTDVRFWGQAADYKAPYFMIYPYQEGNQIAYKGAQRAEYTYEFPKYQTAIAGTFDPKANFSVGIIPQAHKPFVAYNLGGLLRFKFHGASNVKSVRILARGQELFAGTVTSTVTFNSNGTIANVSTKPIAGKSTVLLIYTPESGASMAENTDYFVVLPAVKITKGLTLAFILDNGKAVQVKFSNTIDIKRAQSYSLGDIAINPTKAKLDVITDKGLIDAIKKVSSDVELEADGSLNIYQGYNLDRILKLKGELDLSNNNKLTSLNGLQYFQNITSIKLFGNQNLTGNIDFTKCKQLTGQILVDNCQAVKSINVTGLDIKQLTARSLNGLEQVTIKGNNKLSSITLNNNRELKLVDVSNLPALETLETFYSGKITTINTSNSPNLKAINATSNSNLTNIAGLEDNILLENFTAPYTKLKKLDFTHYTKLKEVNIMSSSVEEIKGLADAGANLTTLQLAQTHISSLDVSQNPNLTSIDLYSVQELTALDVTHNPKLTSLRVPFTSITELKLTNNPELVTLKVAHCKLKKLDITSLPKLKALYAGSQSPNGFLANIEVTMTAAQKTTLNQVKPFKESANDDKANYEDTNSWVKAIVR
jgi:leucine rich repeat protein